jgi:chromosome segregation ATPase
LLILSALNKAKDADAQRFVALKSKQRQREKASGTSIYTQPSTVSPKSKTPTKKGTMARTGQALIKAKQDNDVLKKANTSLTRDITNLKRDNDELQKANETMTQEKNTLDESVGGTNEELNTLKTSFTGLTLEHDHAKSRIADLQSKKAEVQSRFELMKTDLKEAQRNLKALQDSRPEVDDEAFQLMKTDLEEAQRNLKELQDSNAEVDEDDATVGLATHSDEDFNKLKTSNKELTTSCKELALRNKELTEALKMAHESLKEGGKFSPKEVSKNIVEKIDVYVKGDAYREWKFVQGKTATDKFMAEVFKHVVAALPTMDTMGHDDFCSREDFMRIYTQHSCKKQRDRRQYSQTLMFKALVRKSTLCWMAPKLLPMKHLTSLFFSLRF